MMHLAVRLIHYLREDLLRGASSWEMFTYQRAPGFGFLSQDAPQLRSMNYWLYYYFNRHAGRWVLPLDGTAPYLGGSAGGRTYRGPLTPVVATLSQDEQQLYLILANGSWEKTVPVRVTLRGSVPGAARQSYSPNPTSMAIRSSNAEKIWCGNGPSQSRARN